MGSVAANPDGKYLYVGEFENSGSGLYYVATFTIDQGNAFTTVVKVISLHSAVTAAVARLPATKAAESSSQPWNACGVATPSTFMAMS